VHPFDGLYAVSPAYFHLPERQSVPTSPTKFVGQVPRTRILEHLSEEHGAVAAHLSRHFAWLLVLQWLVAIVIAVLYEWGGEGMGSAVGAAVLAGGPLVALPVWLAIRRPAALRTRLIVAVAQMSFGGLFYYVTGGRIESQFHVFASLAFLSAYRDWRTVIVGTAVVAVELALRNRLGWTVTPGLIGDDSRQFQHAIWIAIEVVFLLFAIRQSVLEMETAAERRANLEGTKDVVERIVRDRTAELHAGEQRLKAVYNAAVDGIITVGEDRAIESLNPAVERLFGYARKDLVGLPLDRLIAGADGLIADALMSPALSGLMPRPDGDGEEPCGIRRDGSRFPIELSISKTRIGSGVVLVGVLRDITDRRANETALRSSEARYRLLFESNPHAMWVADASNGRILAVNDSAVDHYGYPRDAFLRMDVADLESSDSLQPGRSLQTAPILGQFDAFRRHRLANGEIRQMEIASRPIEFDGCAAALMMAIDVTERKLLEEQLKQAQKLESIGQLAAGIAHEINTPVQYIGDNTVFFRDSFRTLNGVLTAFREAGGDPAASRAAEQLAVHSELDYLLGEIPTALAQSIEGVRHVADIVRAMKEFAHPGTIEKTPVDLNRTIETVMAVARNEWKFVAEIVTRLDPNLPKVLGLPGELNQVFLNLLVNAAHAIRAVRSDGTKGTITIATRRMGGMAEVRITDTGSGIPEAIRGRIFDPFFTTKPVGEGTGQGLAIAHAVVEKKHGGALSFQTELGRGTTFIVRLPIKSDRLSNSERIQVIEMVRVPHSPQSLGMDWQAVLNQSRNPATP
jgi:two-component system, NtrC family, sensor kinase